MTTNITGLIIQTEFGVSTAIATIEAIIDSCIDTVNSDAGTTIGYMTGSTPTKTVTVTGPQAAALKPLIAIKLASNQVSGGNSQSLGFGGISQSSSVNTGTANSNSQLYERAIMNLKLATRQPQIVLGKDVS
jgi:hypothetical protein